MSGQVVAIGILLSSSFLRSDRVLTTDRGHGAEVEHAFGWLGISRLPHITEGKSNQDTSVKRIRQARVISVTDLHLHLNQELQPQQTTSLFTSLFHRLPVDATVQKTGNISSHSDKAIFTFTKAVHYKASTTNRRPNCI